MTQPPTPIAPKLAPAVSSQATPPKVTRQMVVSAARGWLNTRWRHQGRTREGIDCIGLPVVVCKALGLSNYDVTTYGREPDSAAFLPHFVAGGGVRVNPKDQKDGDVAVFHQRGYPCHCGILATWRGQRSVIHSSMKERRVVEEVIQPNTPFVAVFRLPGITD